MKLKIGQKYALNHSRFGRATVKLTRIEDEWIGADVVAGTLRGMREVWEPGDSITVRKSHCTFEPVKTEPEAPAWTPDEWRAELSVLHGAEYAVRAKGNDNKPIALCYGPNAGANASLIATAPRMAQTLDRLAEDLEFFAGEVSPSRDECGAMAKRVRALLAEIGGAK